MGRGMFDINSLPAPNIPIASTEQVRGQQIEVPVRWWRDHVPAEQLPAFLQGDEYRRMVAREEVWELTADLGQELGPLRLLWGSMAWGAGPRLRMCEKRIRQAGLTPGLDSTLRNAATLASSSPAEAYRVLHGAPSALKYLGPAFGTKFLYFAAAGTSERKASSLILDSLVATALAERWEGLGVRGGWPTHTYDRYCSLLERWTVELSLDRADRLEFTLFVNGQVDVPPGGQVEVPTPSR